jgi:uncharacterized protein YycO
LNTYSPLQAPVKQIIICLSLLLSTNVFAIETQPNAKQVAEKPTSTAAESEASVHEKDAQQVLALIENAKKLRQQLPDFVAQSNVAIKQHKGALPSANALQLATGLSEANNIRNQLFDQALRHRGAMYRVDNQMADKERVAEIVIAMSAGVTLYENNNAMRKTFDKNSLLRKKLNEGYPEYDIPAGFYDSSVARSANPEYRKAMSDAVRYFADNKSAIEKQINLSSPTIKSLYATFSNNMRLQQYSGGNVLKEIVVLPFKAAMGIVDVSDKGLNQMKFRTSQVVGNTMGMVRWRDGKLKGNDEFIQVMLSQLQPGDILLEKTPFTLTDKSIPGHFGHAAIYVGTAEQLKAINAIDLPIVQKHLSQIKAGHGVVEALRSGVQLDSLQEFMNVDDVAILRAKNITPDEQRQAVNIALSNLGKKYDFNFDVNTTDTIVCSELVYIVYPQVDFITKRVMGSFSITPDDIALKAGEEKDPLAVVLFGHDGKLTYGPQLDAPQNSVGLTQYNTFVKGDQTKPNAKPASNSFNGFLKL